MEKGKVSIITASFNTAQFISETIESVIKQTFKNWELIIIDDASTDNSIEVINEYVKSDNRIKLIVLEENSGAAIARNRGLEIATGLFIAFLDSDDIWNNDKLEKQITFMVNNNYPFTYTYYKKIDEQSSLLGELVKSPKSLDYSKLLKKNYIGCLTAMYSVKSLGKIFMPNIRKRQDYATWLSILKLGVIAHCLEEPLAFYRIRKSSISSNKLEMIGYNWKLYRNIEKLNIFRSLYALSSVVLRKILNK